MSDVLRPASGLGRWEGTALLSYKEDGTHFRDVSRQVLFDGAAGLGVQLRYFEVAPGGHTTLERHAHEHLVTVLRGPGRCLVGDRVFILREHDVIHVPPEAWHQFRASEKTPLGFLCLVRCERDRPRLPTESELQQLRTASPEVAAFLRT